MTVRTDSRVRARILDDYLRRLSESGNPIVESPEARDGAVAQALAVLDDLTARAVEVPGPAAIAASLDIGAARAMQGIHPVESVRAATDLFEAALPVLLEAAAEQSGDELDTAAAASVAAALHRAVGLRIAAGAVRYVGFLQEQLHSSHNGERQRVARELHDRTAHTIGVALTSLELHEALAETDPVRARVKGDLARESMRSALSDVRRFAMELREAVEPATFEQSLRDYIEATAPAGVDWAVLVTGDPLHLPGEVCQELFVLLREATRNALVHSGTSGLQVRVDVTESGVVAHVRDTGAGFEVDGEHREGAMGMHTMRERAHLLGGRFSVSSSPGTGTTATVTVPLGRVRV